MSEELILLAYLVVLLARNSSNLLIIKSLVCQLLYCPVNESINPFSMFISKIKLSDVLVGPLDN